MRKLMVLALVCGCGASTSTSKPADDPPAHPAPTGATTHPEVAVEPYKPIVHPWPWTHTVQQVDQIQGKTIPDPYRWLEDEKSPEVQDWMAAQDKFARGELAKLPGRDEIEKRMDQLAYYDAVYAPTRLHDRYFFNRKHADKEKMVVYWKQGEHGQDHVLFDPNTWSADGSKGLHGWSPSWDGARVAYQVSEHNSDETTLHVIDVATGKDLPDVLEGTKYASASWTPDGKGFYYTYVPPVGGEVTVDKRPGYAQLRFHVLGTAQDKDPVVRDATKDPGTFLGGDLSKDGHWLYIGVQHGWNSTDLYLRDARKPNDKWQVMVEGVAANFSIVDIYKDRIYIKTNDGAPRERIFVADPHHPERAAWKEIVAQSESTMEQAALVGGHLALTYLKDATSLLAVHDLSGKHVRDVPLPGLGSSPGGIRGQADDDVGYFEYYSFTEPLITFKTSLATGKTEEWARVKLPIDTSNMVTDQVFFQSKDGTKIPMFIIHNKGAKLDGSNPTILNGYGGFDVSSTPTFAGSRLIWLEHGGVYAIANLRGGGEYGEDWHKAGMLLNKQNVFDDFIGAAETLIKQGWTSTAHLAVYGGSNGGLLVGAAVTQRPDLFKAAICAVPLLDMLRYQLYGSGRTWVPEYGSAEDPAQFAVLYAYSPYRVAIDASVRAYPAILFDSADHDDRVDPMHARKLAAALQARQTTENPILLRIERNSGHGGADMVKAQVARVVDQFAFLLHELK